MSVNLSVIIVSWNCKTELLDCLHSLTDQNSGDSIEILVVDNASSDGTPAYLSEWVANGHNRQLILNDDNRGFAAANNQGLNVATGD